MWVLPCFSFLVYYTSFEMRISLCCYVTSQMSFPLNTKFFHFKLINYLTSLFMQSCKEGTYLRNKVQNNFVRLGRFLNSYLDTQFSLKEENSPLKVVCGLDHKIIKMGREYLRCRCLYLFKAWNPSSERLSVPFALTLYWGKSFLKDSTLLFHHLLK